MPVPLGPRRLAPAGYNAARTQMAHATQVRDGSVVRATAVFDSIKKWLLSQETERKAEGISVNEMEAFLETRWEPPLTVPEKTWILQSWPGIRTVRGEVRFFSGSADTARPPAQQRKHSHVSCDENANVSWDGTEQPNSVPDGIVHQEQHYRPQHDSIVNGQNVPVPHPPDAIVHQEQHFHQHQDAVVHARPGSQGAPEPRHGQAALEPRHHSLHTPAELMAEQARDAATPFNAVRSIDEGHHSLLMPLPGQAGPPTEYVPGAVAVLPSHALPSPPPGRPPSRNAAPQQRAPSPPPVSHPKTGGGGGEMAEAMRRLTYEVAEERARSAGLRGEAEMLRHESAVRLAQERAESAKLRAEVPPPLVLSGHAASLTPY